MTQGIQSVLDTETYPVNLEGPGDKEVDTYFLQL